MERFDDLYTLSKKGMEKKELDALAMKWGKKLRKHPIDKQLLMDLLNFRNQLLKNIKEKNGSIDNNTTEESAQKILNRLIFMRKAEDSQIHEKHLKLLLEERKIYPKLVNAFREYDSIFNSNLFEEHQCDKLIISDQVLEPIINGLFKTTDGCIEYDFSTISTDILGSMYEQYLGYIQKRNPAEQANYKKNAGIYYTPKFVVDYIVKNTLGMKVRTRKRKKRGSKSQIERLVKIKIIDPACGSGSFLQGCLSYLVKADPSIDIRDSNVGKLFKDNSEIIYSERAMLFKDTIYGIDTDPQAVNIARLNTMLLIATRQNKIPTLGDNIIRGNSIFSEEDISTVFDRKILPADLKFDVVLGNPPYYNINDRSNDLKIELENRYPDVYSGHADILYFFHPLAVNITKSGGYVGFITSRYFLEAKFAEKLRSFLLDNVQLVQIIDFGSKVRIFGSASINTCIIIYKNQKSPARNMVKIAKIKKWDGENKDLLQFISDNMKNGFKDKNISIYEIDQGSMVAGKWTLQSKSISDFFDGLNDNSLYLGDYENKKGICKIGQGFTTGMDNTNIIDEETEDEKTVEVYRISEPTINQKKIEKKILRKVIKTKNLRRYRLIDSKEYLIFLHDKENIEDYPNTKSHLLEHKSKLEIRHDIRARGAEWYHLANPRNYEFITSKDDKLFVPMTAPENRFVFIEKDSYLCTGDTYFLCIRDKRFDIRYVQGILNSRLMNFFIRQNSKAQDGSAKTAGGKSKPRRSYSNRHIRNIPIKIATIKKQNQVKELVLKIEGLSKNLTYNDTDREAEIKHDIEIYDKELDDLVCEIYGTTMDEIDKLEGET